MVLRGWVDFAAGYRLGVAGEGVLDRIGEDGGDVGAGTEG